MVKKMIVLNHKMNLEYDEVANYINKINDVSTTNNIIICPSSLYLESFVNYCHWGIGSQNIYYKEAGNYTGEVSLLQLKSLGAEYALVGHYERKKYFGEENELIKKKLNACLDSNISPILCFGETGVKEEIISTLDYLLTGIRNIDFIIFAYEPLKVKNEENLSSIEEEINFIYDYLYDKYNSIPNIIYGGGVVKEDINDLLKIEKLNGILIGKISANAKKITKIIESIN